MSGCRISGSLTNHGIYRLERRFKLRAIVLVVVVVLVLDLFWGINRSARVMPAARFGRSLSLPP
jgi:hypothetical protein